MASTAARAPTRLIELAPQIHERYRAYVSDVLDSGPLDRRACALVAATAAIVLGDPSTIRLFVAAAKEAGMTNEDLGHLAAIVDLVRLDGSQRRVEPR